MANIRSLFRPKSNGKLGFLDENDIVFDSDYAGLMQFIPYNKEIPTRLAEIPHSEKSLRGIAQVLKAYRNEDLTHKIFNDENCQLYLIYLLKEKKIPLQFFLQANIYLSILMQYTGLQKLGPTDEAMQEHAEIKLFSLVDTKIQELFLEQLYNFHLRYYGKEPFSKREFQQAIRSLDKLGQTVIGIKPDRSQPMPSFDLFDEYSSFYPLAAYSDHWYYFPSVPYIELALNTINPNHYLKYLPIFGSINLHTLFKLHQRGFHPINLYSPLVKTNVNSYS